MPHPIALITVATLSLGLGAAAANAQSSMKPSAPQKMMSPEEARKMRGCEQQAVQNNIKMDERSKYVMDCMTAKAK
jgi:hypothetical protein